MRIHIFNPYIRAVWTALACATVASEIIPTPHVNPLLFYGVYTPAKVVCLLALSFLTPLAFSLLNNLNLGIAFAALSATLIELTQGLIGNGHSFRWYELIAKLGIILAGFALGLDARVERVARLGALRIPLTPDDQPHPGCATTPNTTA